MAKLKCFSCQGVSNLANPVDRECSTCAVSICLACWTQDHTLCLDCSKKNLREIKRNKRVREEMDNDS